MTYLKIPVENLVNLEYSLEREMLRSNQTGSCANTTLVSCNTRKYHGLLICPVDEFGGEKFVLLSCLDETVIQHEKEFNLGIHKYPGDTFEPTGHKYIIDFEINKVPRIVYRVGGVILAKEMLFAEKEEQFMIRYTLLDAHSPTTLRFKPFLAFRNIHQLSKANMYANTKVIPIPNGVKAKLYTGFPFLHMQLSKHCEFIPGPTWYYNIEYIKEQERGYDFREDLLVPGFFEVPIKKGESIIFSASTTEMTPSTLKRKYDMEIDRRLPLDNFKNCLTNAARRFIVKRGNKTEVLAGFPWFGSWGRDTFISLPGLTLTLDDEKTFVAVVDTMLKKMKNSLFPNMEGAYDSAFNSVDAPLWFFWSIQQYQQYKGSSDIIWKKYFKAMKSILEGFRDGLPYNITLHDNGLIYAGETGKALTWMDAVVHGKPVTPRIGYAVEINALWYNALMYCIELATKHKDNAFVREWSPIADRCKENFVTVFWNEELEYLADYADGDYKDFSVRPNQVFATSLPYSPISNEMKHSVLKVIKSELLTPRGLRTLSPKHPAYEGFYEGTQEERDKAYHQGTVWPWLIGHYCEGKLKLEKRSSLSHIQKIINGFEEVMTEHGIGTISEIYEGNPPHKPKGAISQAWSVAEILRVMKLMEQFA